MFVLIFSQSFSGQAVEGGILGIAIIGITRAAFSNEAGIGSAAIAHAAAQTEEPAREGDPLGDNHRAMLPTYSISKLAAETGLNSGHALPGWQAACRASESTTVTVSLC